MKYTYINASNTATNGTALGDTAGRDVTIYKILVGAPVSAGNITVYDITNPLNGSTANIAAKVTLPTFSTTNINPGIFLVDFGAEGIVLGGGGNVIIDQTMQVTVVWQYLEDSLT